VTVSEYDSFFFQLNSQQVPKDIIQFLTHIKTFDIVCFFKSIHNKQYPIQTTKSCCLRTNMFTKAKLLRDKQLQIEISTYEIAKLNLQTQ
jgi:hypothetical protein